MKKSMINFCKSKSIYSILRLVIIIVLITVNKLLAQNINEYNGKFESGFAKYQYYENNDFERVFNGNFSYTATIESVGNRARGLQIKNYSLKGQYKNNQKNGEWVATKSENVPFTTGMYTITNIAEGGFNFGLKEGKWRYTQKITPNTMPPIPVKYLDFRSNVLVGKVDFGPIQGNLDSLGKFSGKWTITTKELEYLAEFEKNIFTKLIIRKPEDGSIKFKYTFSEIHKLLENDTLNEFIIKNSAQLVRCKPQSLDFNSNEVLGDNGVWSDKQQFQLFCSYIEEIKTLDTPINHIERGSESFIINYPLFIIKGRPDIEDQFKNHNINYGIEDYGNDDDLDVDAPKVTEEVKKEREKKLEEEKKIKAQIEYFNKLSISPKNEDPEITELLKNERKNALLKKKALIKE